MSANPMPQLWQGELIQFNTYSDRISELTALAHHLKQNLRYDGLRPAQEILVIILGQSFEAIQLEKYTAQFLKQQGIDVYLPTASACNQITIDSYHRQPEQFWCEGAVTISRIHRAKGHQADMVYLVGLDGIAKEESNIFLRHQLLVALTRARAWVTISGIGNYAFYQEIYQLLRDKDTFTVSLPQPPKQSLTLTPIGEILARYAQGDRNFQGVNLSQQNLTGIQLENTNLIGANLERVNLTSAQLKGAKLIVANLSQSNLSHGNFQKAKLLRANLRQTNLSGADLTGADLSDADLTGAILDGAILTDAIMEGTILAMNNG